jgi:sarcosine oxidase
VGAGAVGTSIAYHLSLQGKRTLVLDQYYENHPFGSSHGKSRILRTAYAEGEFYVPLVLRARQLWQRLGNEFGTEIFRPTGTLLVGSSSSKELDQARASAQRHRLPHELLDPEHAGRRFVVFRFNSDDSLLWDPGGGVLFPERAIRAHHSLARARGVAFRWNSRVIRWKVRTDGGVIVSTSTRDYLASRVVLAAGAWIPGLVHNLSLPLEVEQQAVFWFSPADRTSGRFRTMPAFVWYGGEGTHFYGTPDLGEGVKVGGNEGHRVRNLSRRPGVSSRQLSSIRRFLRERLPGLSTTPRRKVRCLYTNAPDDNFIVDTHPESPNLFLVSTCSGHGFKFASVVGELIAKAMAEGQLPSELAPFRLDRPSA